MKLWRLTRSDKVLLDGKGTMQFGGRYSSPGQPIVNFASEAGLAVLITLRYLKPCPEAFQEQYVLGWTECYSPPERVPDELDDAAKTAFVDDWAARKTSVLAAVRSAVLPEADIVLFNPLHPDAGCVPPLTIRPFTFAECLHRPPMLDRYG